MYQENYLASRLSKEGGKRTEKIFVTLPHLGMKISYGKFFENANRFANLLRESGVRPGSRVLIHAPKCMACIELYFGCLLAGAVYTPINPAIPLSELPYFIADSDPEMLVCAVGSEDQLHEMSGGRAVFSVNSLEEGALVLARERMSAEFDPVRREAEDWAAILYTSGTTGKPKGVIHTHASLWSNAHVLSRVWHFSEHDRLLHVLPVFHLHGLFTAFHVLMTVGASCVFMPDFRVDQALQELKSCSVLMGVPPYYMQMLQNQDLPSSSEGVRLFISGSAPMLPQTHEAWFIKTGSRILERYGMTECSMIASNPYDGERKPNTVGFPLPGTEIRIVGMESGSPLNLGDIGMIQIRGPNVFAGYLNKPDKTAEDMTEDGYFVSGDFGRFDEEGYLQVLGRAKDAVVTVDGVVIPKEVEEVLDRMDGISETAVIGICHPEYGCLPVVVYVCSGKPIDEDDLLKFARIHLDGYKCPVRGFAVSELPRNTMGKVQKAELRVLYSGIFDERQVH